MHIKDIRLIFVESGYEIEYHVCLNHNLRFDDKLYDIYIGRHNSITRRTEHILEIPTLIGNPVYLFDIFNRFRNRPNVYFWEMNKLLSAKEIDFPDPDFHVMNIVSYEGFLTPIRFY